MLASFYDICLLGSEQSIVVQPFPFIFGSACMSEVTFVSQVPGMECSFFGIFLKEK